ncbi:MULTISPECIES: NAD(P)/FAD-dependent oxidoreductase [Achromobacter]|uniref:FAD/NAD(P)-binding oxidoreductase n=1 Tax=Achromobacter spanius TaxID=217203 RepID=A0ABY8GPR9_9BURK|nr:MULTISPECIES: FAD/NAD(P)-binding oxidoreductase [Achromobacter]WAI84161.1 NAD(P)/FAD-dependent oxidoreductase [Achromobacter spanius]WEX94244.1 NAD(P)/FAD-dependent oxidoreductase [Achromobacter sp. SS2-2022]WFP06594.1 FAD/NAD(P)-binding oxidoreductase [Achromobacter spanius]
MSIVMPVIVGAGPAGVRAAQALVAQGLRPVILDEAPRAGGQIYRQPPPGFQRHKPALYGFEHRKADAVHRAMNALLPQVDYRPGSLVWNVEGKTLDVLQDGVSTAVPYTHLILATGATDRVLPFPGWLTPGVYTLGGSQVALKFQGCAIGSRVVFMGTGPLLYLVAYQYARAGAQVAAVLDTSRFADRLAALPGMLRAPGLLAKGLYYMAWLRAHGVPLRSGVRPVAVQGQTRVAGLSYRQGGREHSVECDALAYGLALRSETQLASLVGCEFEFNARDRNWTPRRDTAGRGSVPGVYVAGDGAAIGGADAAELAGERAALALLEDIGQPVDAPRARLLESRLAANSRIRTALERAFPFPEDWAASIADDTVICRCEDVTAGTVRRAVHDTAAQEMNRLKALTRVGMGRCQGRMCGAAAAEVLAQACGRTPAEVGRLRNQPPVKPVPVRVVCLERQEKVSA